SWSRKADSSGEGRTIRVSMGGSPVGTGGIAPCYSTQELPMLPSAPVFGRALYCTSASDSPESSVQVFPLEAAVAPYQSHPCLTRSQENAGQTHPGVLGLQLEVAAHLYFHGEVPLN